jgi:predicted amidohydrolase
VSAQLLRLALAQLQAVADQPVINFSKHVQLVREAAAQDVDVIVFPELSLSGYLIADPGRWADTFTDDFVDGLRAELGAMTAIVGLPRPADGHAAANSAAIVTGSGRVEYQDKLYLPNYGSYTEGDRFIAGSDLHVFEIGGFMIAVLICEDAWHGSLAYIARLQGADVIVHPAASATSAISDRFDSEQGWNTICRAEAIYYGTYVVFVNQVGEDHDQVFWGGSKVIAPGGQLVGQAHRTEGLFVVDLRRDVIEAGRELLPMMDFEDVELVRRGLGAAQRGRRPVTVTGAEKSGEKESRCQRL